MLNMTIGNNRDRRRYNIDPNSTIRQAFETAGVEYAMGMVSLDGETIGGSDLDKTFYEMGYTGEPNHDKGYLIAVVKADNA